jgi:Cu2+-exporting ATPase
MAVIKQVFPVTGMSCASCAASIEKVIIAQKGIGSVGVNYANSNALIEYDETLVTPEKIKSVVKAAGYDLVLSADAGSVDATNQKSLSALRSRAIVAIIFAIPLFIIGMFAMNMPYANYIMWALATPVLFYSGSRFFTGALRHARHGVVNMDTLVALSTGIAYTYSIFNTLFPHFWMSRGIHGHVYFEASAVVITFVMLGKILEEKAKSNTSSAIKKLMGLQPQTVVRVTDSGTQELVDITTVMPEDVLLAKPGERIAVDGSVKEGASYVDESMITGEPVPVEKTTSMPVYAGTINQKGSFTYTAAKVGADTLLAHIIKMVQEAQGSKAPVQQLVDKIAAVFVPVVMGIALLSFGLWVLLGGSDGWVHGFSAFVTVLVIACPCALGLATPTAIIAGIGKGAGNGILIKDARSLEDARNVNAIVLDKTGTITYGEPQVTRLQWTTGADGPLLQSVLYSMEQLSEHPLAGALVEHLKANGAVELPVNSFSSIPGGGITGFCNRTLYFAGTTALLQSMNINIPEELQADADALAQQANTIIWFSDHANAMGFAALTDTIKPTSVAAVAQLQQMGIEVYMLTGDNQYAATAIAHQVGISEVQAAVSPAGKAAFIKQLQDNGKIVAMVGDGINDSQALALADVSIAMGKGADIAMQVAGITIISSDLAAIAKSINLSRKTASLIRQNLFWAFIYNVIGIPIAAGILYPVNGFLLNPMIAGGAMALSSVSVVANSLRLKWMQL